MLKETLKEKEVKRQGEPLIEPLAKSPAPIEHHRSLVGQGITVEGKIMGKGDVVVQGTVKGEIGLEASQVCIEEGGRVEAIIQAESVVIRGVFKGSLTAKGLVKLDKTAQFEGELKAARLQMEDGATVKGSIELQKG